MSVKSNKAETKDAITDCIVIKRYSNRKLYDTSRSCYVTLEDIAVLIRSGTDVRIIDNKSKEDLTTVTLTQIILEEEKKKRVMPITMLKDLIKSSGETISELMSKPKEVAEKTVSAAEKTVENIFKKGENASSDEKDKSHLGEFLGPVQQKLDEMQKRMDEGFKEAVDKVSFISSMKDEMQNLKDKISKVEQGISSKVKSKKNSESKKKKKK